ncbi:MAG: family 16 glycoside hydrolase, partial [Planctomycetota bacterium]
MKSFIMLPSRKLYFLLSVLALWGFAVLCDCAAQSESRWKAHDMNRPRPLIVTPAPQNAPVPPPSDAIVLFNGTDLLSWRSKDGGPAPWSVQDGAMIPVRTGDDIYTVQPVGDVQLHREWAAPMPAQGEGQGRGNSG